MSRDSEHQQSAQHGGKGNGQDVDFDAEHSPDVSRRASNAVLHHKAAALRTAEAAAVTNVPQAQRNAQHDKADMADLHAQQSAMMLVAKHLQEDATFIRTTVDAVTGSTNEAGVSPAMGLVEARIAKATTELDNLLSRIGTAGAEDMTPDAGFLAHEYGALRHSESNLCVQITRARNVSYNAGQLIASKPDHIHQSFLRIGAKLKLDGTDPRLPDVKADSPEPELLDGALSWNLTAAFEAARSVRMGLGANTELHVASDLAKVVRHVATVTDLMQQITNPKTIKSHKKHAQEVVAEIHNLERQIESNPTHAATLSKSTVSANLRAIQSKFGH